MERLIYSNFIPSKLRLKSSPCLPRLVLFNSSKFGISLVSRTESSRVNSCKLEDPSANSSFVSAPTDRNSEKLSFLSSSPANLPDGLGPKPHFLKQIADTFSVKKNENNLIQFLQLCTDM